MAYDGNSTVFFGSETTKNYWKIHDKSAYSYNYQITVRAEKADEWRRIEAEWLKMQEEIEAEWTKVSESPSYIKPTEGYLA